MSFGPCVVSVPLIPRVAGPASRTRVGTAMTLRAPKSRILILRETASAIWGRIVKPDQGTLTPETARGFLKLGFSDDDQRRVAVLSRKAQDGSLGPEERAELDEYIRVNNELMILQSRARLSLKRAGLTAS